ncbi:MAG: helix-turn-helix domain-containing protein [Nanoarchaeota archaeon]|nr:helix-turn-helix domain-containing protein [Nanoarchaeota archaeon]
MKKKNETFVLVSMKEDKAKKLANVISSETCRKILDHLAEKDATETGIAKELDIPLSTVHYNLQQLLAAKLVNVEEFHYSKKGKEVNHYTLANKFIVITPDTKEGVSVKIRHILPSIAALVVGAGILAFFKRPAVFKTLAGSADMAKEAAQPMAEAVPDLAAAPIPEAVETVRSALVPEPVIWFLVGGAVVIVALLATWLVRRRA